MKEDVFVSMVFESRKSGSVDELFERGTVRALQEPSLFSGAGLHSGWLDEH